MCFLEEDGRVFVLLDKEALFIVVKYMCIQEFMYSTNHVYLHRPNAFGFWQMHLHLCYETLKRISNFSELAYIKNSKRIWHEPKLHISRLPLRKF